MEIDELNAEAESIKKRQERFGETEMSKFKYGFLLLLNSLDQIQKALEFKEQHKGMPEYELSELLVPIPSETKRYYQQIKQKMIQKNKDKRMKNKNKEEGEKKTKAQLWQKK